MKILFWIVAILSIPLSFFLSILCVFTHGLDLYCTTFGQVVCFLGMFAVLVSIACLVLGILKLRKGHIKQAFIFALMGFVYSLIIIGGLVLDVAVDDAQSKKQIAESNTQLYGEGWDSTPAIDGIPELYQEVLNKFYVAVRDQWPAEQLVDLGAMAMAEHYGDASLDNIGFILTDVNGDSVDELLIGTVAPVEESGTAIFCIYSNPENPSLTLQSDVNQPFYLHPAQTDGLFMAQIGGMDAAWLLTPLEDSYLVDITYQEGALDPAARLTLEMIPFSSYK